MLAGVTALTGAVILVFAVLRAGPATPAVAAPPATGAGGPVSASPAPVASAAPVPGAFDGTWTGALADPDTTTVDVRLTVGGPARETVVEIPGLGCTYRGPGPVAVTDDPARATTEVRSTGGRGARCADAARVRLGPATGPGTDRVRYEVLGSCDGAVCAPRRATGVLTGGS